MMAGASARRGRLLPVFSQLVIDCGPWLVVPPLLAAAYCIYVWMKKSHRRNSWTGFFAVTMAILILLALPILVGAFLPLIDFMNSLPASLFKSN
jgi:predicted membrane-bound mannosyltransferase